MLSGTAFVWAAPASASTSDTLNPGQTLLGGSSLRNGPYHLDMQTDGNLVLYVDNQTDRSVMWSSHTEQNPGAWAMMQTDGNFVLYSATNLPLWQTQTNGHPRASLALQGDGNLVLYNSSAGNPALWNTATAGIIGDQLNPG